MNHRMDDDSGTMTTDHEKDLLNRVTKARKRLMTVDRSCMEDSRNSMQIHYNPFFFVIVQFRVLKLTNHKSPRLV